MPVIRIRLNFRVVSGVCKSNCGSTVSTYRSTFPSIAHTDAWMGFCQKRGLSNLSTWVLPPIDQRCSLLGVFLGEVVLLLSFCPSGPDLIALAHFWYTQGISLGVIVSS